MGHHPKPVGFLAEELQCLARFRDQFSSMLSALVKTEKPGKGELSTLGVLADPFSRCSLTTLYVQQVVSDLKSQARAAGRRRRGRQVARDCPRRSWPPFGGRRGSWRRSCGDGWTQGGAERGRRGDEEME